MPKTSDDNATQHLLKKDEKAHKAKAKADQLERKAVNGGSKKKAEKAQEKADVKLKEAEAAKDDVELN